MSAAVAMSELCPTWGRCIVAESSVEEMQRPSGLMLPITIEEEGLHRGVVLKVGPAWGGGDPSALIDVGAVVYFHESLKIGDVLVVQLGEIVAFEPPLA